MAVRAGAGHLDRSLQQRAADKGLQDLRTVVIDVRRSRHSVHERPDIGRPTDDFQLIALSELLPDRHDVDRGAPLVEVGHDVEDLPVWMPV